MIGTTHPLFLATYVGKAIVIACYSFTNVIWTKDGEALEEKNANIFASFNHIALSNLTLSDTGIYSCQGSKNYKGTMIFNATTAVYIGSEVSLVDIIYEHLISILYFCGFSYHLERRAVCLSFPISCVSVFEIVYLLLF